MCSELIELTFEDQTGRKIKETALLEDLSKRGACVGLSLPLGVGRRVRIAANGFEREAHVRYCELTADGYVAGLEFPPGSDWDRGTWAPSHLTTFAE